MEANNVCIIRASPIEEEGLRISKETAPLRLAHKIVDTVFKLLVSLEFVFIPKRNSVIFGRVISFPLLDKLVISNSVVAQGTYRLVESLYEVLQSGRLVGTSTDAH